jgi:hypothetical protein
VHRQLAVHRDGYTLCFNRDEARSRAAERAPRLFRRGGVECVAPFDGAAGGTWIGVNEFGFAACLLNAYPEQGRNRPVAPRSGRLVSRGFLVLGLLDADSAGAARRRVEEGDLRWFQPFRLLACAPGEAPLLFAWDGRALSERHARSRGRSALLVGLERRGRERRARRPLERALRAPPAERGRAGRLSLQPRGARQARRVFAHRSRHVGLHAPHRCRTVSFARLRVSARAVSLLYSPQSPCAGIAGSALELPRRMRTGNPRGCGAPRTPRAGDARPEIARADLAAS